MAIWIDEDSKILIQGITGKQGTFHGTRMLRYSTNVVGGVTPGKGGQKIDLEGNEIPVFNSMSEAVAETGADVSAIYVPARFAAGAIHEAAEAFNENGGGLIVCITEGIPTLDMIKAVAILNGIILSLIISLVTYVWFNQLILSALIAAAMIINLLSSVVAGVFVPIILRRLNQDPAIAGSVIVTTVTDVVGFVSNSGPIVFLAAFFNDLMSVSRAPFLRSSSNFRPLIFPMK